MNHIRWAGWGVINIEALDRMQRRNYIKRARTEMGELGVKLSCGGSTAEPHYRVALAPKDGVDRQHAVGGRDAFMKVCQWLLQELDDHVSCEDGGVRRPRVEA